MAGVISDAAKPSAASNVPRNCPVIITPPVRIVVSWSGAAPRGEAVHHALRRRQAETVTAGSSTAVLELDLQAFVPNRIVFA